MKEFYELIGLMLGDGAVHHKPGYQRRKRSDSKFFVNLKDRAELREKVLISLGVKGEGRVCPKNTVEFDIGVDLTEKLGWSCGEKVIPRIGSLSDDQLACVLRGSFESDGGVICPERRLPVVRFSNVNLEFVEFVCKGLNRLGVKFSLRNEVRQGCQVRYVVYVRKRGGNLDLFKSRVGFITNRKKERLSEYYT